MKLGIDATFSLSGGAKVQLINMINYFSQNKDIELYIYTKTSNQLFFNSHCLNIRIRYKYSFLCDISKEFRIMWGQFFLPFIAVKDKLDILFCPGNISPIFFLTKEEKW